MQNSKECSIDRSILPLKFHAFLNKTEKPIATLYVGIRSKHNLTPWTKAEKHQKKSQKDF